MKVLGFACSPRIGGNSDLLLDQWLAGAECAGAEVEKVYLDQLQIKPCHACEACREPGAVGCIVQDDMQPLYQKLAEADIWVIATPVYFWGPPAQLKVMVDRWYGMVRHHDFSSKRVALLITMADRHPDTATPLLGMFDKSFTYLKAIQLAPQVVSVKAKGQVKENSEAMEQAYVAGLQAAKA